MVQQELEKRMLPHPEAMAGDCSGEDWEQVRSKVKKLLCRYEYGNFPEPPEKLRTEIGEEKETCAGKAVCRKLLLTAVWRGQEFSFPVTLMLPKSSQPVPAVVFPNFRPNVPDEYLPSEEICDRGVAVASFWYEDVTADNADFTSGFASVYYRGREREAEDPGKIAFWAWAASRVCDSLLTMPEIDPQRIAVGGHSRLGKTALLTGAMDERFCAVYSNNSGCGGAALCRGKIGESVARICTVFPFWFCKNFAQFGERESDSPIDQHDLLAMIAPRLLYVASAEEDSWADPVSEYLGCVAASPAWERLRLPGFQAEDRLPVAGDQFHNGRIGYHLRSGTHYLSRYDWGQFLNFWLGK